MASNNKTQSKKQKKHSTKLRPTLFPFPFPFPFPFSFPSPPSLPLTLSCDRLWISGWWPPPNPPSNNFTNLWSLMKTLGVSIWIRNVVWSPTAHPPWKRRVSFSAYRWTLYPLYGGRGASMVSIGSARPATDRQSHCRAIYWGTLFLDGLRYCGACCRKDRWKRHTCARRNKWWPRR